MTSCRRAANGFLRALFLVSAVIDSIVAPAGGLGRRHRVRAQGRYSSNRCVLPEQFRQPREIDCHLPRLVHRQEAGVPRSVWVGPAVEHTELLPGGVVIAVPTIGPLA